MGGLLQLAGSPVFYFLQPQEAGNHTGWRVLPNRCSRVLPIVFCNAGLEIGVPWGLESMI